MKRPSYLAIAGLIAAAALWMLVRGRPEAEEPPASAALLIPDSLAAAPLVTGGTGLRIIPLASADTARRREEIPDELLPGRRLSVPAIPDTAVQSRSRKPPPAKPPEPEPPAEIAETPPGGAPGGGETGPAARDTAGGGGASPVPAAADAPLVPPVLLKAAWLSYPAQALKRKAEASVEVRILVGRDGRVGSVELVEPDVDPALARAAVESARSMLFRPATRGNEPVAVWYNYRFDFSLPRRS